VSAAQRLSDSGLRNVRALRPAKPRNVKVEAPLFRTVRFAAGFAIGASVPVASWWMAHHEVWMPALGECYLLALQPSAWAVLACLVFSAPTVARRGAVAFGKGYKGVALAVIWEVVMVTSATPWLSLAMLGFLLATNAVACGFSLARRSVR
jgi:hypothetical protein